MLARVKVEATANRFQEWLGGLLGRLPNGVEWSEVTRDGEMRGGELDGGMTPARRQVLAGRVAGAGGSGDTTGSTRNGRITIEIAPSASGTLEVTVQRSCDDPRVVEVFDTVLREISHHWPQARVITSHQAAPANGLPPGGRRGGPAGTPDTQRRTIVEGWLKAQGRMNQDVYARSQGVSTATLRRWMAELREQGQL